MTPTQRRLAGLIARRLKAAREAAGMEISDVAPRVGVGVTTLWTYESDRPEDLSRLPKAHILADLAREYRVSIDFLLRPQDDVDLAPHVFVVDQGRIQARLESLSVTDPPWRLDTYYRIRAGSWISYTMDDIHRIDEIVKARRSEIIGDPG